jgi:hypothetical protein
MVRPDQDRIGGKPDEHVEADETYPIFITFFAPHRNELPKTSGIPPIVYGKSL